MIDANVKSIIQKGKNFLVSCHVGPDGDAMASMLAMGLGLEQMGKEVTYFNEDMVPESLKFLPSANKVINKLDVQKKYDAAFVMDCGSFARLGAQFSKFKGHQTLVNVDHHISNDMYGDLNIVVADAASSGEVVWLILKSMGCTLTPDIATNIYCTLVTDTGSFRYSNTNEHVLTLAAQMVGAGANPRLVAQNLFESQSYIAFVLLARVLDRLKRSPDGRYGWSVIFQKDLKETGADYEMTEEFINYPRAIRGVEVAALFKELEDESFKVSLRSKPSADVSKICQEFGGGGHKAAAACIIKGSFDDVSQKIFKQVENVLR